MKRYILFAFLSCVSSCLYAQNQVGLLPQINTDVRLGNDWKINAKLEGRQLFFQNPFPAGKSETKFERADLELVANKTLSPSTTVGGGYMLRRSDGKFIHRIIQQFTITQKLYSSRLSHRIRTDQTLEKDEAIQLRLRYRLSWEKPLSGLKVDPKEFYLKLNNEYLGMLQDGKGDLEIRGLANLGYSISDSNKIESGVDYRIERLIQKSPVHKVFLNIAFYHSF